MSNSSFTIAPIDTISHYINPIWNKETKISSLTTDQKTKIEENFNEIKQFVLTLKGKNDSEFYTTINYSKNTITLTNKNASNDREVIRLNPNDPNNYKITRLMQENLGVIIGSKEAKKFKILTPDSAGHYNELKGQKITTTLKNFTTNFNKIDKEISPLTTNLTGDDLTNFNTKLEKAKTAYNTLNETINEFLKDKPSADKIKKENAELVKDPNNHQNIKNNNDILLAYEYKEQLSKLDSLCLVMALKHSDENGKYKSHLDQISSDLKESVTSSWKVIVRKFFHGPNQTKEYSMKIINTIATKDEDREELLKKTSMNLQNRNTIEQIIMASVQHSGSQDDLIKTLTQIDHRLDGGFAHKFTDKFLNPPQPQPQPQV